MIIVRKLVLPLLLIGFCSVQGMFFFPATTVDGDALPAPLGIFPFHVPQEQTHQDIDADASLALAMQLDGENNEQAHTPFEDEQLAAILSQEQERGEPKNPHHRGEGKYSEENTKLKFLSELAAKEEEKFNNGAIKNTQNFLCLGCKKEFNKFLPKFLPWYKRPSFYLLGMGIGGFALGAATTLGLLKWFSKP